MNDTDVITPKKTCSKREKPNIVITKDTLERVQLQTRTLPTFELSIFNYTYRRHYSFERNEYLKCHWDEFKENYSDRVVRPFQFINPRHFHFYKGQITYSPEQTVHMLKASHPRTLKAGPGVDDYGQRPIPVEALARNLAKPRVVKRKEGQKESMHVEKPFAKVKNIDGKTFRLCNAIKKD